MGLIVDAGATDCSPGAQADMATQGKLVGVVVQVSEHTGPDWKVGQGER